MSVATGASALLLIKSPNTPFAALLEKKRWTNHLFYLDSSVAPGKSLVINSFAKQRRVITFVTKAPGYDWILYSQRHRKIRQSPTMLLLPL